MTSLRIKQIRSGIGQPQDQRITLRGLGLRGPNTVVLRENTPSIRGMVKKVIHLLNVEETTDQPNNSQDRN